MAKVYVMDNGRYRKVGFSTKPDLRAKQVGQGLPIEVVYTVETEFPRAVERAAHDILAPHKVSREWFDVPVEVAVDAVKAATLDHGSEAVVYRVFRFSDDELALLKQAADRHGGEKRAVIAGLMKLEHAAPVDVAAAIRKLADQIDARG